MNQVIKLFLLAAFAVSSTVLSGCGADDGAPVTPEPTSIVVATGEVTAIQNDIAVDGGILLDVDLLNDGSERLILHSLFTDLPPTDEHLALYDVVRRVEIGDLVQGEGARSDFGIVLEKLWILDGRP